MRLSTVHRLCATLTRTMAQRTGLVVGVFCEGEEGNEPAQPLTDADLTSAAQLVNKSSDGALLQHLNLTKPLKLGETRVEYGLMQKNAIAVVGIGKKGAGFNEAEDIDEKRENARIAAAAGIMKLRDLGMQSVEIDGFLAPDAVGEASTLCLFSYDELKMKASSRKPSVAVQLFEHENSQSSAQEEWKNGVIMGEGQNVARKLTESPANIVTPVAFAEQAKKLFAGMDDVTVHIRDKAWAEKEKMGAFLSVTAGSNLPPAFLEVHIPGTGQKECPPEGRIVFVGKGVTFDSGGISLKGGAAMDLMRADMGGAAMVLCAGYTARRLEAIPKCGLSILIPLVENMPSGTATRPGDIVLSRSGLSVKIDNTDAEGRLILCDALNYAGDFKPSVIIDAATLTGSCHIALGGGAAACYTNNSKLFQDLYKAAVITGDRVWRMPLYQLYSSKMKTDFADLNNIAKPSSSGGGACTAAAFLKEFVNCPSWVHLDIAGVAGIFNDGEIPYIKGMSGRPMRTLVEWLRNQK